MECMPSLTVTIKDKESWVPIMEQEKWGRGRRRKKYPPGNPMHKATFLSTNGYTVSSVKIKDMIKVLPKVNLIVSR